MLAPLKMFLPHYQRKHVKDDTANGSQDAVPFWDEDFESYYEGLAPDEKVSFDSSLKNSLVEISKFAPLMRSNRAELDRTFRKMFKDLSGIVRVLKSNRDNYPDNWMDIDDLLGENPEVDDDDIDQLVLHDGMPTAWVLPQELLHKIILCRTRSERESLILKNKAAIELQCIDVLDGVTGDIWEIGQDELKDVTLLARRAIEAHQQGHFEASQSLATVIIDSILRYFHSTTLRHDSKKFAGKFDSESIMLTSYLVFAPLYAAHFPFWREEGDDPKAYPYNRHVSVHAASTAQYSQLHALIAIMNMTSLILFTEIFADVDKKLILMSVPKQ